MPLPWPAITASISRAFACTRFGGQFVQVLQAALAAQVAQFVDDGLDPERAVFLQVDL
jgi:hypothetical protein